MKFLFWFLTLFAGAVAVVIFAKNPGYVLLVYPPYRIELSLSFFVLGLIVLLTLTYFSMRIITAVLRLPTFVRTYRDQHSQNKGKMAMSEALNAFFEGRYAAAEVAAVRAMEAGESSGINPIIAARSAHELREFDKRDSYLATVSGKSVGETTMRLIARTEFLLDQKQPQLALNSLKELNNTGKHKHIGALQLELKAQQQVHNWDGILSVLIQLEKRSAINQEVALHLRLQAWLEKLRTQADSLESLQALWKATPGEFKIRSKIAAMAAAGFMKFQQCDVAQQILTDSLSHQWDSELVMLFGDCQNVKGVGQIEQAEKWLKVHSDDAGLLLALGKLCLSRGLWGKAQNYLDASNSLAPSSAAYTELAKLAEKLNKEADASRFYKLAMELK